MQAKEGMGEAELSTKQKVFCNTSLTDQTGFCTELQLLAVDDKR
jgi:hypothetical protein